MCFTALCIELSAHELRRDKVSVSFFFSSLMCCLVFQLAYSYNQCIDSSCPTSYHDADFGLRDQHHPMPR